MICRGFQERTCSSTAPQPTSKSESTGPLQTSSGSRLSAKKNHMQRMQKVQQSLQKIQQSSCNPKETGTKRRQEGKGTQEDTATLAGAEGRKTTERLQYHQKLPFHMAMICHVLLLNLLKWLQPDEKRTKQRTIKKQGRPRQPCGCNHGMNPNTRNATCRIGAVATNCSSKILESTTCRNAVPSGCKIPRTAPMARSCLRGNFSHPNAAMLQRRPTF